MNSVSILEHHIYGPRNYPHYGNYSPFLTYPSHHVKILLPQSYGALYCSVRCDYKNESEH